MYREIDWNEGLKDVIEEGVQQQQQHYSVLVL